LQTAGVHKSRGPSPPGDKILSGGILYLLVPDTELAFCQPSGAKNFVVAPRFCKICAFLVKDISFIYLMPEYDIW